MEQPPARLTARLLDAAVELMGRSGRGGPVPVEGSSMEPTLRAGQLLAIDFAPGKLRRGDLVLFRQADYLAVHRLLGRGRRANGGPYLRTRGDGLSLLDPPVDPASVVGRVVAVERASGDWRSLRSPTARAYAWCVAAHDRFWGLGVACGERLDSSLLRRLDIRTPFGRWAAACDRRLLRVTHRLLFARTHPRAPRPAGLGPSEADPPA